MIDNIFDNPDCKSMYDEGTRMIDECQYDRGKSLMLIATLGEIAVQLKAGQKELARELNAIRAQQRGGELYMIRREIEKINTTVTLLANAYSEHLAQEPVWISKKVPADAVAEDHEVEVKGYADVPAELRGEDAGGPQPTPDQQLDPMEGV